MKSALRLTLFAGLMLAAGAAMAANDTPVGTWKQVDATGKTKSIIEITDHSGELKATIRELQNRTPEGIARDGTPAKCTQCEGDLKDKPIVGMDIMWGVTKDDDVWDGGKIVNPADGKVYKVKLTLKDGGQKLDVHGYVGFALMGKSQIWERQ
jgi:uncharacterized protein (DUF2147 family)